MRQHKVVGGDILLLAHSWCARGKAYCWRISLFASTTILPLAHQWCASRTTLPLEQHGGAPGIMLVGARPGATLGVARSRLPLAYHMVRQQYIIQVF
jgi:hypothetical protein